MPERSVTVAAVGDVTLQRPLVWRRGGFPSRVFEAADVAVANLESPCSDRGTRADKLIALRSPAAAARWVAEAGFHAVSLANNHAMDYGWEALADTLSGVREAGAVPFGAGEDLAAALAPGVVRAASGVRVAFIGLCTALPLGSAAAPDRPGAAPLRALQAYAVDAALAEEQPGSAPYVQTWCVPEDVAAAQAVVRRARDQADVVIAVIHWGVPPAFLAPFQSPLADYQRPLAKALAEAGADAIVGHHAHVVHGAELIGRTPVLYSLGNFAFHRLQAGVGAERPSPPYNLGALRGDESRDSLAVVLRFGPRGFVEMEAHPARLDDGWEPAAPEPEAAQRILRRFAAMSRDLDTEVDVAGGVARLAAP